MFQSQSGLEEKGDIASQNSAHISFNSSVQLTELGEEMRDFEHYTSRCRY